MVETTVNKENFTYLEDFDPESFCVKDEDRHNSDECLLCSKSWIPALKLYYSKKDEE